MTDSEKICRKCAKCCYEKVYIHDEVYFTNVPCKFLDTETNLCKVYDNRHNAHIRCMTIEEGIKVRAFPADCPYVQDVKEYQGPVDLEDKSEVDELALSVGDD